jgi:hypothetical protein
MILSVCWPNTSICVFAYNFSARNKYGATYFTISGFVRKSANGRSVVFLQRTLAKPGFKVNYFMRKQ